MNARPDDPLAIDADAEIARISEWLRDALRTRLRRRGLVVGISGGVDSAVCAALCVHAVGPEKVFGLLMPERDSSGESESRGRAVAEQLGIEYRTEDITAALDAVGCYRWRDDAIRVVFPDYDGTWPHKLVIRGGRDGRVNHFALVVEKPNGDVAEEKLRLREYLTVVAATNFKQRVRKMLEYFHADRLNYAVVGTPNRLEYDQGFFVKQGDGAADVKPIAHLFKTQVYALAEHLSIPDQIRTAPPTTDTYSMVQGQDEFYFALPYGQMDLALWCHGEGCTAEEMALRVGLEEREAEFVYADIESKRRTTAYQHAPALTMEPVLPAPNREDGNP
jgi:NAD+ synthase